jgi:hypothetical protein
MDGTELLSAAAHKKPTAKKQAINALQASIAIFTGDGIVLHSRTTKGHRSCTILAVLKRAVLAAARISP